MRLLVIISILFFSPSLYSQEAIPNFVNLEANVLVLKSASEVSVLNPPSGRSPEMDHFIAKMDSVLLLNTGRVNILHIGGSHVQADIYTNVIRHNLDTINGELLPPRGFIFPYKIAKTNNPWNYRISGEGEWTTARNALKQFYPAQGMSGILVHTSDSTAYFDVELNTDSTSRFFTSRIQILGESLHGNSYPIVEVDSVSFKGEMTKNYYNFELPDTTEHFRVRISFNETSEAQRDTFVIRGIIADNDEPGIVLHSVGVNGASVPSYLGCTKFEEDLSVIKPDLVIFAIGINDAISYQFTDSLFEAHYDSLIGSIRNVNPDCALIFITNNDSYRKYHRRYTVNMNGLVAQRAFQNLAERWEAGYWDLFTIMGGLGSMQKWENAGLARRDKVHFLAKGYNIIGKLFADAFIDFYLDYDYPHFDN